MRSKGSRLSICRPRYEVRSQGSAYAVNDRYTHAPAMLDGQPCANLSEDQADAALARLGGMEDERRLAAKANNEAIPKSVVAGE